MKTLKGILIAIVALSMSTGFAADLYPNEKVVEIVSYDELNDKAQSEVDVVIKEYCTALDYHHNNNDPQSLKRLQSMAGYIGVIGVGTTALPVVLSTESAGVISAIYKKIYGFRPSMETIKLIGNRLSSILKQPLQSIPIRKIITTITNKISLLSVASLASVGVWGGIKAYRAQQIDNYTREVNAKNLHEALENHSDTENISYHRLKEPLQSFCN